MDLHKLTNYQLYEIIQNKKLDKQIRTAANKEYDLRQCTKEEIKEIMNRHHSLYPPGRGEALSFKYKLLALVVPFFWVIHVLMTSRYPARGQKRKWNEYWLFFCIGLLIWTIAVVIIGKYLDKT
jgi:hypothetical protein